MAEELESPPSLSLEAIHCLKLDSEVAILCGGLGKRLGGVQKGALLYRGERLIDRLSRLGKNIGTRVLWVERTSQHIADPLGYADQRLIDDPLGGMVGGILAALKACQADWLWTFACDLPLLELVHLLPLAEEALGAKSRYSGIAFIEDSRPQPLAAIWRTACATELEQFIIEGGSLSRFMSLHGKLVQIESGLVSETGNLKLSPLFNLNRPVDLEVLNSLQR